MNLKENKELKSLIKDIKECEKCKEYNEKYGSEEYEGICNECFDKRIAELY